MMTAKDLFAGAGGSSHGAIKAGVKVVWAANHNPEAVRIHQANHPEIIHSCQDLHQADWSQTPYTDIILASPACQGHSRSRGKERAHHDLLRSTAWAVVSAAEHHRSPFVVVENVPDFLKWELLPSWIDAMKRLGYKVRMHVLNSADFGVPQARERVFFTFALKCALVLTSPQRRHVPAREIIDWNAGEWTKVRIPGRAPRTLAQFISGRKRYGDRFLIAYYGAEKNGRNVDKPIGTIRTNDTFAIVKGDRMRMLSVDETRKAMGFPARYILPVNVKDAREMLGNAVPPAMTEHICKLIQRAA